MTDYFHGDFTGNSFFRQIFLFYKKYFPISLKLTSFFHNFPAIYLYGNTSIDILKI